MPTKPTKQEAKGSIDEKSRPAPPPPGARRARKSPRVSPLARAAARYDALVAKLAAARRLRDNAEKAALRLAVAVEKAHSRLEHALDSTDSRAASGPRPAKAKAAKPAKAEAAA